MMAPIRIDEFDGEYDFLSNFFRCSIFYNGLTYPTLEHAYQAEKTQNFMSRVEIREALSPARAKLLGGRCHMRPGWDDMKVSTMLDLLVVKFSIPELKEKLLATGNAELIEGNTWKDTFWGVCDGEGQNMLGQLLMRVRELKRLEGEHGEQQPAETNL